MNKDRVQMPLGIAVLTAVTGPLDGEVAFDYPVDNGRARRLTRSAMPVVPGPRPARCVRYR